MIATFQTIYLDGERLRLCKKTGWNLWFWFVGNSPISFELPVCQHALYVSVVCTALLPLPIALITHLSIYFSHANYTHIHILLLSGLFSLYIFELLWLAFTTHCYITMLYCIAMRTKPPAECEKQS